MSKRYQVFASSTYADLKEERRAVMQTLMEMDCIPSGMELFPAADEEQWEFIKKVIDDCDYYLLIIGGRYGSTTAEGISYTEKEYDYAMEKGIKVIALLRKDMDEIPVGKAETDPELRQRLLAFRDNVAQNRLVKFWNTSQELPGLVALSLSKTIKTYPAIGWVRADRAPSEEILTELNTLRKENESLKQAIAELKRGPEIEQADIASLDEKFRIKGKYSVAGQYYNWSAAVSWRKIFGAIAPYLQRYPSGNAVNSRLARSLCRKSYDPHNGPSLDYQIFESIRVQLIALGLVTVEFSRSDFGFGSSNSVWSLTPKGEALMFDIHTVKSRSSANEA
jgi:hypothetical protein